MQPGLDRVHRCLIACRQLVAGVAIAIGEQDATALRLFQPLKTMAQTVAVLEIGFPIAGPRHPLEPVLTILQGRQDDLLALTQDIDARWRAIEIIQDKAVPASVL